MKKQQPTRLEALVLRESFTGTMIIIGALLGVILGGGAGLALDLDLWAALPAAILEIAGGVGAVPLAWKIQDKVETKYGLDG